MKVIPYGEQLNNKIAVALGYFDAIHIGHRLLINKTVNYAKENGVYSCVLLFSGVFKQGKDVFTLNERLKKLENLLVDCVIVVNVTENFKNKTPKEFLDELTSVYNIKKITVGSDYVFGKNASGNVEFLKEYLQGKNIELEAVSKLKHNELEVSTSQIKTLMQNGNIKELNCLLSEKYFVEGVVIEGKKIGRTIGFKTANIVPNNSKFLLKQGVYLTKTKCSFGEFNSITNVGIQPTVNGEEVIIETHLKDFNEDLYGQEITVYFEDFIRNIIKFDSLNDLKEQIKKDLSY